MEFLLGRKERFSKIKKIFFNSMTTVSGSDFDKGGDFDTV